MDFCPPEICTKIFSLACTDDGSTGRSLSLVSKYVHATSKLTKLQSLSVIGGAKITACAAFLETIPPPLRRVCHLFISADPHVNHSSIDRTTMGGWNLSSTILDPPYGVTHSLSAVSIPDIPAFITTDGTHNPDTHEASLRILRAVAPTLETLDITFPACRTFLFPRVHLPALTELTVRGPVLLQCAVEERIQLTPLPKLRRLHIADFKIGSGHSSPLFEHIAAVAPSLTHLRLSVEGQHETDIYRAFARALGIMQESIHSREKEKGKGGRLPLSIKRLMFQPGPGPPLGVCGTWMLMYYSMIADLRRLERQDPRFILLPAMEASSPTTTEDAEREWLGVVNGYEGCWEEDLT